MPLDGVIAEPNDGPGNPLAMAGGALGTVAACWDQDIRHAQTEQQ